MTSSVTRTPHHQGIYVDVEELQRGGVDKLGFPFEDWDN
jgi:hypothetical protein